MPTKGRPRLALDSPASLLLRQRLDDSRACAFGPIVAVWGPSDLTAPPLRWVCPADQLQIRWHGGTAGVVSQVALDPPGSISQITASTWILRLPLEQLLLAADDHGRALYLGLDGMRPLMADRSHGWASALVDAVHELCHHAVSGQTAAWLALEPQLVQALVAALLAAGPEAGWTLRQDRGWQHLIQTLRRMADGLGDDITLTDLSNATGVSPRALQLAFRRHLQKRPLQSLRELRLASLRRLLLSMDRSPGLAVALQRCGLPGNGTTARHFQELFGEKPSQTRP